MKSSLLIFLVSLFYCIETIAQTIVQTKNGKVEGYSSEQIRIFKGIPFATPPLGDLRWKAPQPAKNWKGIRKCTSFSASPMQASPKSFSMWSSEFLIPEEPISEDCLYLNIWTGAKSAKEKRPVLVYIYGGGFVSGGSACPIYDGEAMAKKGVVFVTFNYRVGVFGFFAHPELSKESGHNASGNYALMDMIAALQWIKANIVAFGGDPANVTIGGQSAGAFAVSSLAASPLAKGLFHKLIGQSGGSFYLRSDRFLADAKKVEKMGDDYAKSLNCNNLADLRAKSATELQAKPFHCFPIADGYVVPKRGVLETFKKGLQNDVPSIVGWTADEFGSPSKLSVEVFKEQAKKRFGALADDYLKAYPAETDEQAIQAKTASDRDETFAIQNYSWAKLQTQTGKAKAFVYNFNRRLPFYTPETNFGAFHSGEIVYFYNNLHTLNRPWEETDKEIANKMSDYWVNFAKTGNPNGKNLPLWKAYNLTTQPVLIIDKVIESKPLETDIQMKFWEKYFVNRTQSK